MLAYLVKAWQYVFVDGYNAEALIAVDTGIIVTGCPVMYNESIQWAMELQQELSQHGTLFIGMADTVVERQVLSQVETLPKFASDYNQVITFSSKLKPVVLRYFDKYSLYTSLQELLQDIGLDRTVPVEIGRDYTADDWTQELMTVREFAHQHLNANAKQVGYMAQHDLQFQMPHLRLQNTVLHQ